MAVMDFYSIPDKAIQKEIGQRFKSLRLRKNMTQQALAEASMLSLNTIKSLEMGHGKIATIISVLRELGALNDLNNLVPEISISPIDIAKRQGKVRKRASGRHSEDHSKDDAEW